MEPQADTVSSKPDLVTELEKHFGKPSQAAFGSSVFLVPVAEQSKDLESKDLESAALEKYQYFVGESWDRLGAQNWINGWAKVYSREPSSSLGILTELKSLTDREARQSASLMLENTEDAELANKALQVAFDSELIAELSIYKIGDCSAMSGILIAAKLQNLGNLILLLLLD